MQQNRLLFENGALGNPLGSGKPYGGIMQIRDRLRRRPYKHTHETVRCNKDMSNEGNGYQGHARCKTIKLIAFEQLCCKVISVNRNKARQRPS
jgi:hypothetical protein